MNKDAIIQYVRSFPDRPGVYLMHDAEGNIIYIGKAKSLKKRVSSYFKHGNFASPRLRKLVDTISDISTIRTESEIEALILENRLIKQYQPFFNIDLKMNERYAYIKVTAEKFPRLVVTRYKQSDGSVYIGPYVRVSEVRGLLRLIERYLPLRSCCAEIKGDPSQRPCMRYSLGLCLAPCASMCTEADYRDRAADVVMLLQGRGVELVEKLRRKMDRAAKSMAFEEAARLRDTIRAIWRVSRQKNTLPDIPSGSDNYWETLADLQNLLKLPLLPWRIDGFDISHTGGENTYGVVVVFEQGYPNSSLYRRFKIRSVEGIDDFRSMKETITRRYKRCLEGEEPMPQLILVDGGSVQLEFARKALSDLGLAQIPSVAIAEGFEDIYTDVGKPPLGLDHTNKALRLLQSVRDEAHRYAITSHRAAREKSIRHSSLEDVPGIGRAKAAQLITRFGSIKAIRKLPVKELASVPGIGQVLAKRLSEALQGEESGA